MRFLSGPGLRLLMVLAFGAGIVQLAARPAKMTVAKQIERPAPIALAKASITLAKAPIVWTGAPIALARATEHETPEQCLLVPPRSDPAPDESAHKTRSAKPEKKIVACS